MYKAVIFDMDGLMFDTENYWIEFGIDIAKNFGYNLTEKFINKITGTNYDNIKRNLFITYGDKFPIEDFYEELRNKIYNDMETNGIRIKKGLIELLKYLKDNNYLIAIASSTSKIIIEKYLSYANIDKNIFNIIVSGVDFKNGKPFPDIYINTCKLLNIKSDETLVLEDSTNGIISAYNANCDVIWIPDRIEVPLDIQKLAINKFDSLIDVIDFLK